MTISRRSFLGVMSAGGAVLAAPPFTARGREAAVGAGFSDGHPALAGEIRLDSNENPYGPAPAALDAVRGMFGEAARYPDQTDEALITAIAQHLRVPEDHLLLGSGSGEVLRVAVDAFTSSTAGLITAAPTFELPADRARVLGVPVTAVRVDQSLALDLDAMAAASPGAGLVFLCNPNNPTATVHGAGAIERTVERVLRVSSAFVLVDEAYHEYVEDPGYRTMIPLALREPRVLVARTFSKVYGLAGLRVGYAVAHPETLQRMEPYLLPNNVNVLAAAAGRASLEAIGHAGTQAARNREVRRAAMEFFRSRDYAVTPSQTNFIMVDIRREMGPFRAACLEHGIRVGRPFPPLLRHVRVSIGTAEEMEAALRVFDRTLR